MGIELDDPRAVLRAVDAERLSHLRHEELWMVVVNYSLEACAIEMVSRGGEGFAAATVEQLLEIAARHGYERIFLIHNHPSGETIPSNMDHRFTARAQDELEARGYELVDHLIVGGGRWRSILFGNEGAIDGDPVGRELVLAFADVRRAYDGRSDKGFRDSALRDAIERLQKLVD